MGKTQIEIANPLKVIQAGEKVNHHQVALLDKLNIRPFESKIQVHKVLDNGKIYCPSVLNINSDDILNAF